MKKRSLLSVSLAAAILGCTAIVLGGVFFTRFINHNAEPAIQPNSLVNQQVIRQASEGGAAQAVQHSWLLAKESGAYSFHTEIEQTTYSAPAVTNVGRAAQVQRLTKEGQTDLRAKSLHLTLWQNGAEE